MIDLSPGLPFNSRVFRGMDFDIFPDIFLSNKKYFFKPKNFFATSFDPNYSIRFVNKLCCFYSITLPPKTKGLFIFNNFNHFKNTNKIPIDQEHEFLLPRNSLFEVIKSDIIANFSPDTSYTYG